jgi:chitin deacetylase
MVRAHPELAGREATTQRLTEDSMSEQGRLGFTALTRAELDRMSELNRRYREAFGFPAIVALALHRSRDTVMAEIERRLTNSTEVEVANAIEQIGHITRGRLARKMAQA